MDKIARLERRAKTMAAAAWRWHRMNWGPHRTGYDKWDYLKGQWVRSECFKRTIRVLDRHRGIVGQELALGPTEEVKIRVTRIVEVG